MAIADTFPDVNEGVLEKFLALVRDRYPLADKANYFLETKEKQSGINIAITNQRDVLSHLVTLLTPGLSVDGQTAQLYTAEEHLRRAILESYETALNRRLEKISGIIPHYTKNVVPRLGDPHRHPSLSSAPDNEGIKVIMRRIDDCREKGRQAKRKNMWTESWEDGVSGLVEAYALAETLHRELQDSVTLIGNMRGAAYSKYGYVVGVVGLLAGVVIAAVGWATGNSP
jgi:hypothetical protein